MVLTTNMKCVYVSAMTPTAMFILFWTLLELIHTSAIVSSAMFISLWDTPKVSTGMLIRLWTSLSTVLGVASFETPIGISSRVLPSFENGVKTLSTHDHMPSINPILMSTNSIIEHFVWLYTFKMKSMIKYNCSKSV